MGDLLMFPVQNRRIDVPGVTALQDALADDVKMMKLAHFAAVSDQILDDALRSISVLKIEGVDVHDVDQKDLILIKESIVSTLCRMEGMEHPLHRLMEDNLIVNDVSDDDDGITMAYKFREETSPIKG